MSAIRGLRARVALGPPEFRLLGIAAALSGFSMLGEMVIVGWLALEMTGSPLGVGITAALRALPLLILGVPAGVLADTVDRGRLLRILTLAATIPGLMGALLIATDQFQYPHLLGLVAFAGSVQAFRQTALQSFAYDLLGSEASARGLAVANLATRLGGFGGSLAAGAVTQQSGPEFAYLLLALGHSCALVALAPIHAAGSAAPRDRKNLFQTLRDFWTEARSNRTLLSLAAVTAAVEILGFSHQVLLPSIARDVLHLGAGGLGVLSGARSIGGIVGLSVLAFLGSSQHPGRMLLAVLYVFGFVNALLGQATELAVVLVILVVLSAMAALSDVLSQTMMQLCVPNELRGRAAGSWILAIGAGPIGHSLIGAVATVIGIGAALGINGGGLLLLAVLATWRLPSLRRL